MGQLVAKILNALNFKKKRTIVMLSMNYAGKTTILH